jgi:hypothetical protein
MLQVNDEVNLRALGMTVEDVYTQNRKLRVRLREKGGKRHGCRAITTSRNTSRLI